jgi:DNA (cytosine-5)-methyltransferase 1
VTYRLLDLFCCQGGAGMGYHHAGFEVEGVDINPQPRYPFKFHHADALQYLEDHSHEFDAIHASPPCQSHSSLKYVTGKDYTDLIPQTRDLLKASGLPWIIENVERAPLENPVVLCGTMFGLKVLRHRKFETSFFIFQPSHFPHAANGAHVGRCGHKDIDASGFMSVAGHFSNVEYARQAMGISWMNQGGLAQSIPPAYTEFIGRQLVQYLDGLQ